MKTLKEIELHHRKHNENIGIMMSCFACDLRAEAIKWIKELEECDSYDWQVGDLKGYNEPNECWSSGNMIDWIMHFFNISEEDLK